MHFEQVTQHCLHVFGLDSISVTMRMGTNTDLRFWTFFDDFVNNDGPLFSKCPGVCLYFDDSTAVVLSTHIGS